MLNYRISNDILNKNKRGGEILSKDNDVRKSLSIITEIYIIFIILIFPLWVDKTRIF